MSSGVSTWTCVSPRFTVAIVTPAVLLLCILPYVILDKTPLDHKCQNTPFADVLYKPIDDHQSTQLTDELSPKRRLLITREIYLLMIFLFWQYFVEALSLKAIITTLAFPEAPFQPRDHFSYYVLSNNIAKFLSRSCPLVFSFTCSSVSRHLQIKNTWMLATVGVVLMFLFVFASWYRFIPYVEVILILCFIMGLCTGFIYAYSPLVVSEKITENSEREFAQGMLQAGPLAGDFAAGFLGLYVEPNLNNHCTFELGLGDYCLTRFFSVTGWTKNVHCM